MDMARPWTAEYTAYWRSAAARNARRTGQPVRQDRYALEFRPVDVRADLVTLVEPRDLNVVYQRPSVSADERFDLVIATNVLVYYGIFEQALALSNIAAMLTPGGLLVSNDSLPQVQAIPLPQAGFEDVVYASGPSYTERLVWYRRR
jgi:chemotaxis methyl-accepting protein methylase